MPVHGGINPKRARAPYNDFFDKFLIALNDFYYKNFTNTDKLKEAIVYQQDYFKNFTTYTDFIDKNYLWSFTEKVTKDSISLQKLSGKSTFEEYVLSITDIVKQRGQELYALLHMDAS